jgi:hypothetical protein
MMRAFLSQHTPSMNTLSVRVVGVALFLVAPLFADARADTPEALLLLDTYIEDGPTGLSGAAGWPTRIAPQADLAMGEFTQISPRKQEDCG